MRIELLFWPGCPSHEAVLADLREAMAELDLDPALLRVSEVATEEEAVVTSFPGSPTIRVDGVDVEPGDERPQLTCRIYRRPDGRISPTPDPTRVRAALAAANQTDTRRNE
jgi:hypothetical protein